MYLLSPAELRIRIKVAVKTTPAWVVRDAGTAQRPFDRDRSIEALTDLLLKRLGPYAVYALNSDANYPERLDDVPKAVRLSDIRNDEELIVHLREGEECLHNPGYKTGAYFCCKPAGHKGPHDYVPSYYAIVTTADDAPPAAADAA